MPLVAEDDHVSGTANGEWRWEDTTRKNYGKGVGYANVDGRDVIYVVTAGFYLVALNAETGHPIPYFGMNGIVDLQTGLGDYPVHPDRGTIDSGDITSSAPPIIVNGLEGVDLPNTGKRSHATILATKSLLIYGEGRSGAPLLHAVDKAAGREIARVEIPAPTNTAPMTYMHNGKQHIVLSVAGEGNAGRARGSDAHRRIEL